jgi:hypothetical protein
MRAIVPLALCLALLSACYRLDTSSGKFRCDAPGDVCPAGTSCIAGLCRDRSDEHTPQAEADLRPADLTPAAVSGCAASGGRLAARGGALVFACEGGFAQGGAPSLCRAGYHVCGAADEALLLAANQDGRCTSTPSFYASQVEAALTDSAADCKPTSTTPRRALLGCGAAGTGVRTHPIELEKGCSGLHLALPCEGETPGWTCTKGLADATHSQGERGGVLCCSNR